MQQSDVVIIGGGPAGLLAASYLARHFAVTVLERGRVGSTSKFWLSTSERLASHGLDEHISYQTSRSSVGTFLGARVFASGDFVVVDEDKLLSDLHGRCLERGVVFRERTHATSLSWRNQELTIKSSGGDFAGRLVIDASGGASPIAQTFRLHRIIGFYSIFGCHMKNIDLYTQDIVGAEVLRFGDPPPLFEVVPTGPDSAHVVLFEAVKRLKAPETLRALFDDHVENNPFFSVRTSTIFTPKFGAIPIGRKRARFLPGVLSIGEAAVVQAPLLGTAFNEVLDTMGAVVSAVEEAFRTTDSGLVSPRPRFHSTKGLNDLLQIILARVLLRGGLEGFERLVRFLGELGPERAYRLFCSRLSGADWVCVVGAATRARLWSEQLPPKKLLQQVTGD